MKLVDIPHVLTIVIACWRDAEANLRQQLRDAPNSDEDFITKLFHLEFSKLLRQASESSAISTAFIQDLESAFPDMDAYVLTRRYNGLVAEVSLHKPEKEKVTGGDLGLLLLRPLVIHSDSTITIKDYRRGLLSQAKMKRKDGKWGGFTPKQKTVLPKHLSYLALLLYQYRDRERRELRPFAWQLCSDMSFHKVEKHLKRDIFPSLLPSESIVQALGKASIGTDDDRIIDNVISTAKNPCLIIRIDWPDDRKPPPRSFLERSTSETQHQEIKIRH